MRIGKMAADGLRRRSNSISIERRLDNLNGGRMTAADDGNDPNSRLYLTLIAK
jgi:hypothetical protein